MSLEGGAQDVAWRVPKEEINKHYVVEIMSFFTLCRKIKSKLTELYKSTLALEAMKTFEHPSGKPLEKFINKFHRRL